MLEKMCDIRMVYRSPERRDDAGNRYAKADKIFEKKQKTLTAAK